ncbi:MAG: hypothetical protein ABJG14_11010 [Sulfitobacter sp.]|uniref:hypothetical protein n=1 Tax=Alphaproteobacteria TaxID=28211 RepID=UPI003267AD30
MRRWILPLSIFLAAGMCDPKIEYVPVKPEVPADLLVQVPISDRKAETYRDLAILATEHLNSAQLANAKIGSLAEIIGPQ